MGTADHKVAVAVRARAPDQVSGVIAVGHALLGKVGLAELGCHSKQHFTKASLDAKQLDLQIEADSRMLNSEEIVKMLPKNKESSLHRCIY